jgi:hypothetical protein
MMRRSLSFAVAVAVLASIAAVVSAGAAAASGPGVEVGPVGQAGGSAPNGVGLGVTGALPLHPDTLATAKSHANAAALGNGRLSGGTAVATQGWSGVIDSGVTPPDTTGAIGPNSYIEVVNLRYAIYSRTGTPIASGPLEGLTAGSRSCLSDPQVIWDADGQRFFYSALDTCNDTFMIGFSRTANPTGGGASQWCQYSAFQYGSSLPDYPKLGDSKDFIMIGSNVFTNALFTYIYDRSDIAWINKSDLYVDGAGNCNYSGIRAGVFVGVRDASGALASTPVPANGVEYQDPTGYVVADPDASSQPNGVADHLSVFRVTADGSGNAVLAPAINVPVAGYSVPAAAKQPKTRKAIDTSDGRLTQAVAAYDPSEGTVAVWTQHTVFGGVGAQVRWYEISGTNGAMLDHGIASSSSLYVFNGAISSDRAVPGATGAAYGASMGLTFNTSSGSGSNYSAIQYVTKPVGGTQSGFVKVLQSPGPNIDFSCSSTCRWGDYAGASPDPVAGATGGSVWFANQWNRKSLTANDVDWRTQIFSVGF